MSAPTQIRRGVGLAAAAALAFGATVPLLKKASADAGVFVTGGLLYLGASIAAFGAWTARRRRAQSAPLGSRARARLLVLALLGAVCAPALLVLGVKRTDAVTTSLLLTLEAPFTMLLARLVFHEHVGRRAIAAAALILVGALLAAAPGGTAGAAGWGAVFVAAAMLVWAVDNAVSRTFADRDPLEVVALKGILGSAMSGTAAAFAGEPHLGAARAAAIFAIGTVGYGASLAFYLRAQALMGAARTASVFATAPFIGAVVALVLGAPWPGTAFGVAAALMTVGVWLHASEHHAHRHSHQPMRHEHVHTHDDGHHTHVHDPMPGGPHSHEHEHEAITHEHEHGEDIHHRHHDH